MVLEDINPEWLLEEIDDIPLNIKQYDIFCRGYSADWECRYEPISLGDGWHYIYRSGYLLKKFRYQIEEDGMYHIKEHYTTEKGKGLNLLQEIMRHGYFEPHLSDVSEEND